MYVSMMDYMKQYPSPQKSILIQNAMNDIVSYKKKQYGSGYDKKVKSLANQIVSKKHKHYIQPGDLSIYTVFTRIRIRDKLKELIDHELRLKKKKKKYSNKKKKYSNKQKKK